MQVWNWTGKNRIERTTVSIPQPGLGEVLLRIRAAGICGTDLHILQDKIRYTTPPLPLGHEIAGEVVACGTDVTHLQVGDRCAIDPLLTCGQCDRCRAGRPQHCPDFVEMGITAPGGWQAYLLVPASNCYLIPDLVPYAVASQTETLSTVVGGVDRLAVKAGQSALVIGDGMIGLLFSQLLQNVGCVPVVNAGIQPFRLTVAQQLGIEHILDVRQQPLAKQLQNKQFDIVVDAVGSPQTIQQALSLVTAGGKVLLFGLPAEASIPINILDIILREITVLGGTNAPHVWQRTINLIATGRVKVAPLITHRFTFAELPKAIKQVADCPAEAIKVIVEFGEKA